MAKEKIVGIDLGTSTSEIAVLINGKPVVIPNHIGEEITPSVVGISQDGDIIVGRDAQDQLLARPTDTVMEIKRLMGSNSTVEISGRKFTPQQVSAEILKYLKTCAEEYLGENLDRAVITVPAYFTNEQRRATVEAGKLAGFKVERIINEPTAAALAYGIENMEKECNILVYDLGGGTLDVTLLEMFDGVLEVKASSGNNRLGGKDFDQRLIEYFIKQFKNSYGIDLSNNIRAMARFKDASEKCKKALSEEDESRVTLPFIAHKGGEPLALDTIVTREIFEGLIEDLIKETQKPIDVVLKDSGLDVSKIDVVLLVGGSTRIPAVKSFLKQTLHKEPKTLVDPDLAVVMGAAIQSAILNDELDSEQDILITDVCPYTLGISTIGYVRDRLSTNVYSVIIPRNITIPVTREETYFTAGDNQTRVNIEIYQGDNKKASRNNPLGNFFLENIPPNKAGEEKIKVNFTYDINGILQVEAYILSTGDKAGITIETTGVEVEQQFDIQEWGKAAKAKTYRSIIRKAEKFIDSSEDYEAQEEVEEICYQLKKAILLEKSDEAADYEQQLVDLLYELEE